MAVSPWWRSLVPLPNHTVTCSCHTCNVSNTQTRGRSTTSHTSTMPCYLLTNSQLQTNHNLSKFSHLFSGQCSANPQITKKTRRPATADSTARRHVLPMGDPLHSDMKGTELPPDNILIPLERQLTALQLCRWQFLYNETLQQTSHPLLSKLS